MKLPPRPVADFIPLSRISSRSREDNLKFKMSLSLSPSLSIYIYIQLASQNGTFSSDEALETIDRG